MMKKYGRKGIMKLLILVVVLAGSFQVDAQKKKKRKKKQNSEISSKSTEEDSESWLEPYDEVITKKAESDEGLFTTHKVEDKFYFEIPDSMLGREMLIVSRRAAMSGSELDNAVAGESPGNALMVKWEKSPDGKNILLRKVTTRNILRYRGTDSSFERAVELQTLDPIMLAFPIKTVGPDKNSSVIDIADIFLEDVKELTPFGPRDIFELMGFKPSRSYSFNEDRSFILETKSFEENIEVRSLLTYTESGKDGNVFTILMHRSMVLLPEEVMQPRLADERIGHFAESFQEYHETRPVDLNYYIKRWRLELREEDIEKFKNGELVEPKEPIVFYIDGTTPEKWRSYIKQGVEDWQPAFEEAGFRNAIVAREAPVDDPDYHPEDIRYSVIRYVASDIKNAKGPSVVDPRSGEILESDVIIYHNVLELIRNWRFAQTAANDERVRTADLPDEIIGEGLRYVVAHEVGHALGLRHNMGASSAFPVDSLRSATFTQKYGTTPSIMDYARFNYVAQPEDEGVKLTPPQLGVYDKYAIRWAYRPILTAKNEYEEKDTLNSWIAEHTGDPLYYFGEGDLCVRDPSSMRESLGDDVVKASEYGVENIKYIISHLDEWLGKTGEKYDDMENYYLAALRQYNRYLTHTGTLIGGVYLRRPVQGQDLPAYEYVPEEKQREAVRFLLNQYRELPKWLENKELKSKLNIVQNRGSVRKIQTPSSYIEDLYYSSFSLSLINDWKLMWMIDDELSNGADAYGPTDLFDDIRNDVFRETMNGEIPGYYRKLMQDIYVSWLLSESHFEDIVSFDPPAFTANVSHAVSGDLMTYCSHDLHAGRVLDELQYRAAAEQHAIENDLYYQTLDIRYNEKRAKITSLVLAEVKKVKRILEKYRDVEDEQTRAHYDYLLQKISMYLVINPGYHPYIHVSPAASAVNGQ